MQVSVKKLKSQLMKRIDAEDLLQVEKVERYINMVNSFRTMNATIEKEGESVETINASQTFIKAHPLINERNKVNAALLHIEKSFGFTVEVVEEVGRSASDLL